MNRTTVRETVFKLLFQSEFYEPEEVGPAMDQYLSLFPEDADTEDADGQAPEEAPTAVTPEELDEVRARAQDVLARRDSLDEVISSAMEGWKLGRLGTAERNILRLAVYEILFDDQVPVRVAVNEAVELARKYGGDEAPGFVNGVLGRVIRKDENIDAG